MMIIVVNASVKVSFSSLTVCDCVFCQKRIAKKVGHKMMMKLTPGVNFLNILCKLFCQNPFAKKSPCQILIREKMRYSILYKKCARKMLMKLIPWK